MDALKRVGPVFEDAVVLDTETYPNYFLCAFKSLKTGKVVQFERGDGLSFDPERLARIMKKHLTVGFNSLNYDLVMIYAALAGYSNKALKKLSDRIILKNARRWDIEREYGFRIPKGLDHIDLIEVAPGKASLKVYGGRLHAPKMWSLPVSPDAVLTHEQIAEIRLYNINDLDTTALLYTALRKQLELRTTMSAEYGEDLRSKSDAQIAEAVIKSQVSKILRVEKLTRPEIAAGTIYKYRVPPYIQYQTKQLRDMLEEVRRADFMVSDTGKIVMPEALESARIKLGFSIYRMGIGGLHSSEKTVTHIENSDYVLRDNDVESYYPNLILTLGLAPKHLGRAFLDVYRGIVHRRIDAKHAGNKTDADSLKIVVNGSFGKLGSKWSVLYSPDLMIQVTVTGQLALLLLIERIELAGIRVVSANTDGIVSMPRREQESTLNAIVAQWEKDTGLKMEQTEYSGTYSRDVNNYYAFKTDGSIKSKGAYASPFLGKKYEPDLKLSPHADICSIAAAEYLSKGVPIEETVVKCRDIRQFVVIRTVNGGAVKDGVELGKAVRWYYGTSTESPIAYVKNGNKVPKSEGAVPCLDMPETFPSDVNYSWYISEARKIITEVGALEDAAVYDL